MFSEKEYQKIKDIIIPIFIFLAIMGLADSVYLTIQHFNFSSVVCVITDECDTVLTSDYSKIAGIPVALLGAFYYFAILVLSFASLIREKVLPWLLYTTPVGFLASAWFVFVQLFILDSICSYCMLSAATSALIFGLTVFILIKNSLNKKSKILPEAQDQ
jgi:uncharacterized membrane protein